MTEPKLALARRALTVAERKTGTTPVLSLLPPLKGDSAAPAAGPPVPDVALPPTVGTPGLRLADAASPPAGVATRGVAGPVKAGAAGQITGGTPEGRPTALRAISAQPGQPSRCTLGELKALLSGMIQPGSVIQVTGAMSALFAAAAVAWAPEVWGAIVGLPEAGLLAAAQTGLPLARCVVVPGLGVQPLRVLAGLIDAFGVVVAGPVQAEAADRRRLEARLRRHGGCLLTSGPWGGAAVQVAVSQVVHPGLGPGGGPLEPGLFDLTIQVRGQGQVDTAGARQQWAVRA